MGDIDTALTVGLEGSGVGVLTSVATSGGQREWVWYCRPPSELNPAFNAALTQNNMKPIGATARALVTPVCAKP